MAAAVNNVREPIQGQEIELVTIEKPKDDRIEKVVNRSICRRLKDYFGVGMAKSKALRFLAIPAAILLVLFLVTNPIGWITSGVLVSLLVTKLLIAGITLVGAAIYGGVYREQIKFELGYYRRKERVDASGKAQNFHEIITVNNKKLILGVLPNLYHFKQGQDALGKTATIFSVNSPWERERWGFSIPYTVDDWHSLGHTYARMDVQDHKLLSPEELNAGADLIHKQLEQGNVYVHCKAGESRSAAVVAAYLMKYGKEDLGKHYTIEDVCAHIKTERPKARIWHKVSSLVDYDRWLRTNNIKGQDGNPLNRPKRSMLIDRMAWSLRNKIVKEISDEDVEEAQRNCEHLVQQPHEKPAASA